MTSAVVVTRGGMPESVHAVAACVTDADGRLAAESTAGAGAREVFVRSAAKPFQALAAVRTGVPDALGLGELHLAVGCASHDSSEEPVRLVEEILDAAGLDADALGCGTSTPLDRRLARELGESLRPIHHNCSGKHALGLALCVHEGWPPDEYLEPAHPLQEAMRTAVAATTGAAPSEAVDGCGMRAYRMPLAALAAGFGRLARGGLAPVDRVAAAITAAPRLIGVEGGVDVELMRAHAGLVAKLGAEGVIGVGLPDGRGLALKVLDGARRALDAAAVQAVRTGLGIDLAGDGLEALATATVKTARGAVAGTVTAELELIPVR